MNDETVFLNGRIFTSDEKHPYADAMIVKNGKIFWIGDEKEVNKCRDVVDLKGRTVLPGFIDAHMHPLLLADAINRTACTPPVVNSIEDIKKEIRKKRELQGPGKWIEGWGFDEEKLAEGRTPNRHDLDEAVTDAPVVLTRTCCHILSVNSAALKLAGIDGNTPTPSGGFIDRDEDGEPIGILKETARYLIQNILPEKTKEDTAMLLAKVGEKLLSQGITVISEAFGTTGTPDCMEVYSAARGCGLKQKVALYYMWDDLKSVNEFNKESADRNSPVFIGGVKVLADGTISGKTAWVNPGYYNDEANHGLSTVTEEELLAAGRFAKENNLQLIVHAMGEQAIDLVVNTFSNKKGWLNGMPSIRIEHAAMPSKKSLELAAKIGIAFVSQPIFMYAEIESYIKNLGAERTKTVYPYKDILNEGIKLCFSSDAPATAWADPSNPWVAIKSAVTRKGYDGTDTGQSQKLDVETAVRMYTSEAQGILGIPNTGRLIEGHDADFIVLDRNIFETNPHEIDEISVAETYINGEMVFKNK
ncbi:MAG TPA: amidohydrolase [Clostridiales bacterium]|nr:amidohydrolase [Clostridiales bacterium]